MFPLAIILVTSFGCSCSKYTYSSINGSYKELWVDAMPWVGILWYKESTDPNEAISGIIRITKTLALGNAQEVSKIYKMYIQQTTKAMFISSEDHSFYCHVVNYALHPEFERDTLNTVALVMLECQEENDQWQLLEWPLYPLPSFAEDMFAVGFTDRNGLLEQVAYQMKEVQLSDCIQFYQEEQLDMKWMTPMQYHCFVSKYYREQCVFNAGMALVTNRTGNWVLLGMSTLGPGCSLPSRFLDFSSYVPWIEEAGNFSREIKTRRAKDKGKSAKVAYEDDWSVDDLKDTYFWDKLNATSIVLKPVTQNNKEDKQGDCVGKVIYGEDILVENGQKYKSTRGYGVYQLSYFDTNYFNITCVSVTVDCVQKSDLDIWQTVGFGRDDLIPFIKHAPVFEREAKESPDFPVMKDTWPYAEPFNVSNLFFKFEYFTDATFKIRYYGTEFIKNSTKKTTTTTPATTTTPITTTGSRTRRSHNTHIRSKKRRRRRKKMSDL